MGGTVRDKIRGIESHDIDVATNAVPSEIKEVANRNNLKWIPTGEAHGTISILFESQEIHVTTFRIDSNYNGRHAKVHFILNLYQDLERRDFTINAMAMDKNDKIYDPFNGQKDITNKIICAVGNPQYRFNGDGINDKGDKLRTMRAIRFATTFGFDIEKNTWEAIKNTTLEGISRERIRDELIKILMSKNRVRGIKLLDESGILQQITPEIKKMKDMRAGSPKYHPEKDIYDHTLIVLSRLKDNAPLELILAALLHDVGKPPTWDNYHFKGHEDVGAEISEEILRRLKFPLDIINNVKWLVANHMRIGNFAEMRKAKKIRLIEAPLFNELYELFKADCMVFAPLISEIETFRNEYKVKPKPPVQLITGHDILAMGIKPGPIVAQIIESVEDEILEGKIKTREDALLCMIKMKDLYIEKTQNMQN